MLCKVFLLFCNGNCVSELANYCCLQCAFLTLDAAQYYTLDSEIYIIFVHSDHLDYLAFAEFYLYMQHTYCPG